jgi:deoxyribose-phosphate aldolase
MSSFSARRELARLIEHTLRNADATRADLERLCAEAREHGFASVCVNGSRVIQAVHLLEETEVKVTCAVGFPLGASDADTKRYETDVAIDGGAHFIEVSLNIGRLKDGDDTHVLRELRDIVEAADERPVSVYLDVMLLTGEELRRASRLAVNAPLKGITLGGGSDATSTAELVKLIREAAGGEIGVKVDNQEFTLAEIATLVQAGATRFGMAQGVKLIESMG